MTNDTSEFMLEKHRRLNGECGEHLHTAPEGELDVDDEDEDEDLSLFDFEHDGTTYEDLHEGESTYSIYTAEGTFITNFTAAVDPEDHSPLMDSAFEALGVA